jgi:hypothetical protein
LDLDFWSVVQHKKGTISKQADSQSAAWYPVGHVAPSPVTTHFFSSKLRVVVIIGDNYTSTPLKSLLIIMSTDEDDSDSIMPASVVPEKVAPPVVESSSSSSSDNNKGLRRSTKRKKMDPTDAAAAAATAEMNHQVTKLLHCLSRGHLENIIATSIQTRAAVTVENLEAALPVKMQ